MLQTVVQQTSQTANPQSGPPTPGLYPGSGKAALLRPGQYVYVLVSQNIAAGQSSIAVQLERTKSGFYYPIGFSAEIAFSATPGSFEVDVQTSDTDQDGYFVTNTKLTSGLNANNVGRIEMTNYWALFTRLSFSTLTGFTGTVTAKLTR